MEQVHIADWLTVRRVRIHALLLAVAIWTAFFVNLDTPGLRDRGGLIKGTDFLHFYTLGTLAREGRGDLLYNIPVQTNLLQTIVPEARNYVYVPLYGPQVSLFFYPFAKFSYVYALVVWSLLNVLIYGACCYAVFRCCPSLANYGWTVLIVALAFPGISQLLAWGQTSGLALFFFTLAYLALRKKQDFLAGLAIGCLIFKPQLGLAAAVVFVFTMRRKVVIGAIWSALVQMAIGWLQYGTAVMNNYVKALTHIGLINAALCLAKLQFSQSFLSFLLIVQAFFFALVLTTTGVPRKPKRLRIWLIRYRSCEKCNGPVLLVKNTNVGGRTDACVT